MAVTTWQFSHPPDGAPRPRRADVTLAVFGCDPLDESVALSREDFGIPGGVSLEAFTVRAVTRAQDPGWFDGWRTGSLRAIAEQDLDADALAALDAAEVVHLISIEVESPRDLGYLQAAWGMARLHVARGGTVVLDAHAMAFVAAGALPAADAPLDVRREVRKVFETSSQRPEHAHALHTRGLRKFGAPDLIALCTDSDARFVAHAMGEIAELVARGALVPGTKQPVDIAPGVTWFLVEDEHRLGDILQLNNAARVIVDEAGDDLVGVLGRLPRGST